jgi:hypothetical protein
VFGNRPLKVELWISKEDMEQEKKQKENREMQKFFDYLLG